MIEVEDEQRDGPAAAARVLDRVCEQCRHLAPVQRARERIGRRLLEELALQLADDAEDDVDEHDAQGRGHGEAHHRRQAEDLVDEH